MASEKKSASLTLKRTVRITAIVTTKFKSFMNQELQKTLQATQKQLSQLEIEHQNLERRPESEKGSHEYIQNIQLVINEKNKLKETVKQIEEQQRQIGSLSMGSKFNQGMIEGFVNVKKGDDLYKKLGGMEIIVEDGIIQDIQSISSPTLNAGL